jgi:hypothetical protein
MAQHYAAIAEAVRAADKELTSLKRVLRKRAALAAKGQKSGKPSSKLAVAYKMKRAAKK